jgi:hypothetical protein
MPNLASDRTLNPLSSGGPCKSIVELFVRLFPPFPTPMDHKVEEEGGIAVVSDCVYGVVVYLFQAHLATGSQRLCHHGLW